MNINLDDHTVAHLNKLAQHHNVTLSEMVEQLMAVYEADHPVEPLQPSLSLEAIRYFGLFEQSNDAVFLLSLDGKHLECNQRAAELLGYTSEELSNLTSADTIKPSEHSESTNMRARLLAGEKPPPYKRTFIHRDGTEIPVELNVECIFDDRGNPLYVQSIARDIRERLTLLTGLQKSERRFRAIFNSTYTFIGLMQPDGTLIETNQTGLDFAGVTLGNTLGKPIWETGWFSGSERTQIDVKTAVKRAAKGEFVRYETTLHNQKGETITVDFSIKPVEDDDGNVVLLVPEARNITERKIMEQRLQEGERRFRAIFNSTFTFIGLIRLDGTLIEANQTALDFTGLQPEDVIGKPFWEAKWWQLNDATTQFLQDQIEKAAQGEFIRYEVDVLGAGTTVATIDFSIKPIFNDEGEVVLLVPEGRDITERKIMEQRLQESEQRYLTILSAMAEGLVIHNETGAITLVNPAAEEMLGLTFDQMRGLTPIDPRWHTIHDNGDPFPGETHPASISLTQGIPQANVVMGVYKTDELLTWLSINSIPTFDNTGNVSGVIATFSDITDLKLVQQAAVRMAVERERIGIIARFIQAASHEFRTPLSIISTSAYIMRRKYGELVPEIIAQTNKTDAQINRINRLLEGLLLMAKVDAIVKLEKVSPVNLSMLISEIIPTIADDLRHKHQTLNFKDSEDVFVVNGSKKYLVSAITAILENAIRFSPLDADIDITVTQSDDNALLIIEDYGIGIEADDLPFIFQRFWRKDLAHTQEGFGLGLSIAQRIIDLHHGKIIVTSIPDQGTQVIIELPKQSSSK